MNTIYKLIHTVPVRCDKDKRLTKQIKTKARNSAGHRVELYRLAILTNR